MKGNNRQTLRSRLKWRCRRGSLELDVLLGRYLDQCFDSADDDDLAAFLELLDLQDPQLNSYLIGGEVPQKQDIARIVRKIRSLAQG